MSKLVEGNLVWNLGLNKSLYLRALLTNSIPSKFRKFPTISTSTFLADPIFMSQNQGLTHVSKPLDIKLGADVLKN